MCSIFMYFSNSERTGHPRGASETSCGESIENRLYYRACEDVSPTFKVGRTVLKTKRRNLHLNHPALRSIRDCRHRHRRYNSLHKRVRLRRSHLPGELHAVLGNGQRNGPQLRALCLPGRMDRTRLRPLPGRLRLSDEGGGGQGEACEKVGEAASRGAERGRL